MKKVNKTLSISMLLIISTLLQSCIEMTIEKQECKTTSYLYTDPISVGWQTVITAARVIGINKSEYLTTDSTKVALPIPSDEFVANHIVEKSYLDGRQILTMKPKSGSSGKYIFYIHGGGYVANIANNAYDTYINKYIDGTGATMVLPDYGLAPYHTFKEGYAFIEKAYMKLVSEVGANNIFLLGDSAGGGFVLGFTQKLKLENKPLPKELILLAPWLDITLVNPDIAKIQDPILNIESLKEAGLAWAANTDPKFYQLSPIYGNLEGLPPMNIFIGGRDMFLADNIKLRKLMSDKCLPLTFYEYPQMPHVWMGIISSLPESKKAIAQIVDIINKSK
jgi:acetyl esterase/lipase